MQYIPFQPLTTQEAAFTTSLHEKIQLQLKLLIEKNDFNNRQGTRTLLRVYSNYPEPAHHE